MTFEIALHGRTRAVSVERVKAVPGNGTPASGQQFRVTIDGEARVIDAVRLAGGALSLVMPGGGPAYHVAIAEASVVTGAGGGPSAVGGGAGELTLAFPGATVRATVNGRRVRHATDTASAAGEQRVAAPMPGRVLRVLVAPGDEVAARQPLVVVEAMKMENELTSPKAGHVTQVLIAEGQSVEAGRLLIVVE